jgi:hypothetical protein
MPMSESVHAKIQDSRRPSDSKARVAIEDFLTEELGACPEIRMVEDGDQHCAASKCGWAFWILPHDATSYVHEDLSIEWYGTSWDDDQGPAP